MPHQCSKHVAFTHQVTPQTTNVAAEDYNAQPSQTPSHSPKFTQYLRALTSPVYFKVYAQCSVPLDTKPFDYMLQCSWLRLHLWFLVHVFVPRITDFLDLESA